jgi:hypothetical protein
MFYPSCKAHGFIRPRHESSFSISTFKTPLSLSKHCEGFWLTIHPLNIYRFTLPEKLGMKEYSCGKCGKSHVCFRILPLIYLSLIFLFVVIVPEFISGSTSVAKINMPPSSQDASKRLSIRKLPPVLVFQLKVCCHR